MTFGSASSPSVAIGTQRMPSGARVRAGWAAADARMIQEETA